MDSNVINILLWIQYVYIQIRFHSIIHDISTINIRNIHPQYLQWNEGKVKKNHLSFRTYISILRSVTCKKKKENTA